MRLDINLVAITTGRQAEVAYSRASVGQSDSP